MTNVLYENTIYHTKILVKIGFMKITWLEGKQFWFLEKIWLFEIPLVCSGNQVGFRGYEGKYLVFQMTIWVYQPFILLL